LIDNKLKIIAVLKLGENLMKETKVAVFGTGFFYQKQKEKLYANCNIEVCAFFDNNKERWGAELDGIMIYSPQNVNYVQYDYIVLMSGYATDMYEQLIHLGVNQCKILYWGEFLARYLDKRIIYHAVNVEKIENREKALFVLHSIDYGGSAMTAFYASKIMQKKNYKVDLIASTGDIRLINEINANGIDVTICEALPYNFDKAWYREYKVVLVNTFLMIKCACEISHDKPVLWWIHEAGVSYDAVMKEFSDYADKDNMKYLNILAVSNIAQRNFNTYFPYVIKETLCFGIPDSRMKLKMHEKMILAIIGNVDKVKSQDIFLKAACKVVTDVETEFWVIGNMGQDKYCQDILELAENDARVKIKGVLTRKEMHNAFSQIDIVVCPSCEETMSIAIVEGMMFGKVCITTENTGVADYIQNGENGFVVPVGDIEALRKRMQWIIDNRTQMNRIGLKARETYEKYFSMEIFGEHLEKAVNETIEKWKQRG